MLFNLLITKEKNRYFFFHWSFFVICFFSAFYLKAAIADEVTSPRFILKLKDGVVLSHAPTLRRLEKEGEDLNEVLNRNGLDATWLRAGPLGTHIMLWGDSVRDSDKQPFLNRLSSDPAVQYAEPDVLLQNMAVSPNDPSLSSQWALVAAQSVASARFDEAWEVSRGGANVVVAVVDSGVVMETPELAGRLLAGYDFITNPETANDGDGLDNDPSDPGDWVSAADLASSTFSGCSIEDSSWHGTFIAGQIAANTNNGSDISGSDWNAKILPVRVSGKCKAFSSDLLSGILWSAGLSVPSVPVNPNPADVINVSLGAAISCTSSFQDAVNQVTSTGAVVVASAGNTGGAVLTPANCSNVISVGAIDKNGARAAYSAIGSEVDLMAPGGFANTLLGLSNSGSTSPVAAITATKVGTSFSAPYVSAAAAILKQVNSDLTPAQITQVLLTSARSFVSPIGDQCNIGDGQKTCDCNAATCGAGMLDVSEALAQARTTNPVANASTSINSGRLVLDGSLTKVAPGRVVASYSWEQVAGTSALTGVSTLSSIIDVALPSSSGDYAFKLTVTDSAGQTDSVFTAQRAGASIDTVSVPGATTQSSNSTSSASVTNTVSSTSNVSGGGGGSMQLLGLFALAMLTLMHKRNLRLQTYNSVKRLSINL